MCSYNNATIVPSINREQLNKIFLGFSVEFLNFENKYK